MMPVAGLGTLGFPEIALILGILVLLFGARKIPELARGLGEGIKNFRSAMRDEIDSGKKPGADADADADRRNGPGA